MPANRVAENVLGTMGTVCWTIQLFPQIWLSYRTKSTEGLSEFFMLLCAIAGSFLGTYAVVQDLNVPLIVQPQLFGTLCLVSWCQCQYYGHKRPRNVAIALFAAGIAISAGFQVGMIFVLEPAYRNGNLPPVQFFGIFSSVLIGIGMLPQYYEIYKHKEVVGISLLFMTIDLLGGVFNDLSLAFKGRFDVVAGALYTMVVVMDGIILLCAAILNPIARRRRKRQAASASGVPVPDVETAASSSMLASGANTTSRASESNNGLGTTRD